MIPEYIPIPLFEKTTSDFKNKVEKRLENLDNKINADFKKIEILHKKIDVKISEISNQIKVNRIASSPVSQVTIWTRFNLYMSSVMLSIKNYTLNLFKRKV
jgi:hypothetical protein